MKKQDLIKEFALRLRQALIAAGYGSSRSTSGININKLANLMGYSPQICRKYLRGEVIPEPGKLTEIATKLNVSPGWLLFGDSHSQASLEEGKITISKEILHYIFSHIDSLYKSEDNTHLSDFLTNLTYDISQIKTDNTQSKKIIDIALSSAKHFKHNN